MWPGTLLEFERAIITLSLTVRNARDVFDLHSVVTSYDDDLLEGERFYKTNMWSTEKYNNLVREYEDWLDDCHHSMFEVAKAANWFADVVRRDVNPLFFAEKGKFVLEHGPYEDMKYRVSIPEYTDSEKLILPDSLKQLIGT